MTSPKGFTLIELLVVLIIIGIASSVVFLSIGKGLLMSKEKDLIKHFGQTLTEARARSIGQGRPIYFLIYGDQRAYGIEGDEENQIPEDVEIRGEGIQDFKEGVYAVTFFPDGSSSGGTIILSMPNGRVYYFKINKFFGAIKLEAEQS